MVFQCINIRQVPREGLKTAASGLGFQHLPRDLANVNAWKTMFDPYIVLLFVLLLCLVGPIWHRDHLVGDAGLIVSLFVLFVACLSLVCLVCLLFHLVSWVGYVLWLKLFLRGWTGGRHSPLPSPLPPLPSPFPPLPPLPPLPSPKQIIPSPKS